MGSHEKWRLAYQASPQAEAPKNLVRTEIKSRQVTVVVEIATLLLKVANEEKKYLLSENNNLKSNALHH